MLLQAAVTLADLRTLISQALPVRFELGDGRSFSLAEATDVRMLPGRGVLVRSSSKIVWSIAGVSTKIETRDLGVSLSPKIGHRKHGPVLEFDVRIEDADIVKLPALVEAPIIAGINAALEPRPLVWDFSKTLGHRFELPESVKELLALTIGVAGARTTIDDQGMVLTLSMDVGFERE